MSSGWLILQVVETVTVQPRDNHDTLSFSNGLVWFGLVWFGLVWFGLVWLITESLFVDEP